MAEAYRQGKTDSRDAYALAETIRQRRGFAVLGAAAPHASSELRLLLAHRRTLVGDRKRSITRIRDLLTGYFPALERAFPFAERKGAIMLLTGYQTPKAIRDAGQQYLDAWLTVRRVQLPRRIAEKAVEAAEQQHIEVAGQAVKARLVAELAADVQALDARIAAVEQALTTLSRAHPQARLIESMPGYGPLLAAEVVATVGDFSNFPSAAHLAAFAGLVPIPHDSGDRIGNFRKPKRYNRHLRRAFYLAAHCSTLVEGPSKDFYDRKRSEGQRHNQAVIALARRRVDVLWALVRDNRTFQTQPSRPAI
jgi:transposase